MKQVVVAGDISDERTLEAPGTRLRVKPEPVGQRLPTSRVTRGWKPSRLALASDGWRMERAMGIEPTAQAWEAWVLPLYDARLEAIITRSDRRANYRPRG